MNESADYSLWLASTSPYRQKLLQKTGLSFSTSAPNVDESSLPGESPSDLVQRLALAKAKKVAESLDDGYVIGSDQVAVFAQHILGKPHTTTNAVNQLQRFSGQKVSFLTGLALFDVAQQSYQLCCEPFHVHFRPLNDDEIRRYIELEQPLDCAGSFKSEGLGISLFEKLEGDDPNSLIGLPLIRLLAMLRQHGINPLC